MAGIREEPKIEIEEYEEIVENWDQASVQADNNNNNNTTPTCKAP